MKHTPWSILFALAAGLLLATAARGQAPLPGISGAVGGGGTCGALAGAIGGTCDANVVNSDVNLPGNPTTTTQSTGDASTKVATDAYVAAAVASLNPAVSVQAATITVLSNTPTYSNGTAGVGATLTAGSVGALTIDGYAVLLNDRILVKNQASTFQNGVYTQTTLGTGGVAYILTRATDYNSPTNINYTGTIPVIQGSTLNGTGWNLTTQVNAVGTDALSYTQAAAASSGGPPGGNVKASGNLANGSLVQGQGGKTVASFTLGGDCTFSTPNITCTKVNGQLFGTNTVSFSATPVFNFALGTLQTITLTSNVTSSTVSNPLTGWTYTFLICQNGTGNFTLVWPVSFLGTMTIGATASKCSTQSFVYNGTSYYAVGPGVINE